MNKTVLDEFLNRKTPQAATVNESTDSGRETENDEIDYRAYGVNRGVRQALMLDVRTLTEGRRGFSYSYLENIFFDVSGSLVLSLGSHKVMIEGRNLTPLYEALLDHKVRYIRQENPQIEKDTSEKETFISGIEISESR